jgi:predicted dehydrogenase
MIPDSNAPAREPTMALDEEGTVTRAPGVVVVGTGFGCFTHVRALRSAGFDVLAVVGRDPEKTRRRAKLFDVPRALVSLEEALALSGVQAVTIATPPHTHAAIAHQAIAAGKHLICEKPLARDVAEGEALRDAAERAGIVALVGTEFASMRDRPPSRAASRAAPSGSLVSPRSCYTSESSPIRAPSCRTGGRTRARAEAGWAPMAPR